LSAQFYEDLLYRGWRRSGTLFYKPDLRAACCPHYTIRLDANAFKTTKDQRQTLNRFNRYVLGEDYIKESARSEPRSKEETARRKQDFNLVERVHEAESKSLKRPKDAAHNFVVTLESNAYTEEKYKLFENYQRVVHHEGPERITKSGFHRFLCQSPLMSKVKTIDGRERRLGSYHQCYRLDGKLVAVGVLDLLPHAVSAVYFMYDESFHAWSPGKLSAMREAALAQEEGYKWYLMGFYIHSCQKMKYKMDFHPQEILDPESYDWDLFDEDAKARLDARPYVSLSAERKAGIEAPKDGTGTNFKEIATEEPDKDPDDDDDDDDDSCDGIHDSVSLFSTTMPGILAPEELTDEVMNRIYIKAGDAIGEVRGLPNWDSGRVDDPHTLKGIVSELVACVGDKIASNLVVEFTG
jgi:arginine-tRNA-protein transferase